jgi:lipopolysaccharide biosynthesis glycosyltransferase
VVHYAGPFKPWDDPECDFAQHFWLYARLSPFYEALLGRLLDKNLKDKAYDPRRLARELEETRALLQSVDVELKRFERRPLGLMAKELVYQKMLTPVVERLTRNNEGLHRKIRSLYRTIHPQRA